MRNLVIALFLMAGCAFGQYGPVSPDSPSSLLASYNVWTSSNLFVNIYMSGKVYDNSNVKSVDAVNRSLFDESGVEAMSYGAGGSALLNRSGIATLQFSDRNLIDSWTWVPVSAPSSTNTGSMYYDSDDNKLKLWTGAAWVDLN